MRIQLSESDFNYIKKGHYLVHTRGQGIHEVEAIVCVNQRPGLASVSVRIHQILKPPSAVEDRVPVVGELLFANWEELSRDSTLIELNSSIFKNAGVPKVDHVAIQTGFGMMETCVTLFKSLGYTEDKDAIKRGDWGVARFMRCSGSTSIQLTEPSVEVILIASENHVAIEVDDPGEIADRVDEWAFLSLIPCSIEGVDGNKWFVTLPTLLAQSIEFVPNSVC